MERNTRPVKRKRGYDATGRRAQAARTRNGVLETAERMFLRHGYAATTIGRIARTAGVPAETIYKGFGGKAGLVRALRERNLAGTGPTHAEERSDQMRTRESDPRRIIANWGRFVAEVAPRVAPVLLLVRAAAAADPQMAALQSELDADRLTRMTVNARHLYERGQLRSGVTLQEAADVLWAYSSAELYELLVLRRGWRVDHYGEFVAAAMAAALLPQGRDAAQRSTEEQSRTGRRKRSPARIHPTGRSSTAPKK